MTSLYKDFALKLGHLGYGHLFHMPKISFFNGHFGVKSVPGPWDGEHSVATVPEFGVIPYIT